MVSRSPRKTSNAAAVADVADGQVPLPEEEHFRGVAAEMVAQSRAAQGLPPCVEDDAALRRVAVVVTSGPLRKAG